MLKELLAAMPPSSALGGEVADEGRRMGRLRGFADEMVSVLRVREPNQNLGGAIRTVSWMYLGLFALGAVAAVAVLARGFFAGDALTALALAGVSALLFGILVGIRPLDTLERNAIYSAWLAGATNSYWTRVAYLTNPDTAEQEVKRATDDLVADLTALLDKHGAPGPHVFRR